MQKEQLALQIRLSVFMVMILIAGGQLNSPVRTPITTALLQKPMPVTSPNGAPPSTLTRRSPLSPTAPPLQLCGIPLFLNTTPCSTASMSGKEKKLHPSKRTPSRLDPPPPSSARERGTRRALSPSTRTRSASASARPSAEARPPRRPPTPSGALPCVLHLKLPRRLHYPGTRV